MCGLQEGMKILNRFGYKNQTDDCLIMADNFRPENCFVIRVCVTVIFRVDLDTNSILYNHRIVFDGMYYTDQFLVMFSALLNLELGAVQ